LQRQRGRARLDRRVDQLPERIERYRIRDRYRRIREHRRRCLPSLAGDRHRHAAGADPSEKALATLDARTRARSGQKPTLYYTTRGIVIGYQDSLSAKRQYTGETMELKGGYTGLSMNGRTVLEGDWCPKGHYYSMNLEKRNVAMVDVVKMGYVDLDGSKLHRIEGRHSYRADLWFPHNAIWFLRAAQGRMKNVATISRSCGSCFQWGGGSLRALALRCFTLFRQV
jgi:hypothetical protein